MMTVSDNVFRPVVINKPYTKYLIIKNVSPLFFDILHCYSTCITKNKNTLLKIKSLEANFKETAPISITHGQA